MIKSKVFVFGCFESFHPSVAYCGQNWFRMMLNRQFHCEISRIPDFDDAPLTENGFDDLLTDYF
jgi:hypothetical protein